MKLTDDEAVAKLIAAPLRASLDKFDKSYWELTESEFQQLLDEAKGGEK